MKIRNIAVMLCLGASLAGCGAAQGLFSPLHKEQAPEAAAAESPQAKALRLARFSIDEANAALTAFNQTIGGNVANQVWTPDEAQSYLDESKGFGKRLDQAREALRLGNIGDAQAQAEALRAAIIKLQQLAAQHRTALEMSEPIYI